MENKMVSFNQKSPTLVSHDILRQKVSKERSEYIALIFSKTTKLFYEFLRLATNRVKSSQT